MSASRDGNGTFNRAYDWTDDAANSIPITASRFDTEMDGIASELTNSVAVDGQSTMTGNLKMGGFKVSNVGSATASTDAPKTRQIIDNSFQYLGTTSGTSAAYTLSPTIAVEALATGQEFSFKTNAENTLSSGNTTLAISGLTATNIKKFSLTGTKESLVAGDLKNGLTYKVRYDGTDFLLLGTESRYMTPPQPQLTVFTSSGTFTTSANISTSTKFKFLVTGGGGGGSGCAAGNIGSGGGAGATAIYHVSGLSPSTGYTVTVGAAGSGGSAGANNGTAGGNSSVVIGATTVTGGGGGGGTAASTGGTGGTATNGTINLSGATGGSGRSANLDGGRGGRGGDSFWGGAGDGGIQSNGVAAASYGSGGGGGQNDGGSTRAGGSGSGGIVTVEWVE